MNDDATTGKATEGAPADAGPAVPLIAANVGLLVLHLAVHGVGFVGLTRREGLDVAVGTIPVLFLLQVIAPVLIALAIATKFLKAGPNRNAAAVFAALLITLPCCTCGTLILPNVPKAAPASADVRR